MAADAQALVRQLTENPEVLESMQHMLSLLRGNAPKPAQPSSVRTAASGRVVRPPRTGYDSGEDDVSLSYGASQTTGYSNHYNNNNTNINKNTRSVGETHYRNMSAEEREDAQQRQQLQQRRTTSSSSSARAPRRSAAVAADSEEAHVATLKLAEAQRRIAELEKELQRTTQRVDQLSEVVQQQKSDLQDAQDRHQLELEETRQAYDAVVRRKDEVQEEALRQLLKSRQLMASAAKFEAVVAAKRREKENVPQDSSASYGSLTQVDVSGESKGRGKYAATETAGLTSSAAGVNARYSSHLLGSGVKRERAAEEEEGEDRTDSYSPTISTAAAAANVWGTPTQLGRVRQEKRDTISGAYRGAATRSTMAGAKTESPEFSTSPTLPTKSSAGLVAGMRGAEGEEEGNGGRTHSRSVRKRRTPRTPSLTNADRLAASQQPYSHAHHHSYQSKHASNSGSAPAAPPQAQSQQQQPRPQQGYPQQLPGTNSLKLDSPTPVVSTTWTVGRSLTTSPTPPPPLPSSFSSTAKLASDGYGISSTSAVNARQQQQQQQHQQKAPLLQRTAGRLAPAPVMRAVPNTRSGTSSVVADGPTRSPSPVNPKRGNAGPRRFIFTGLKDDELRRLSSAVGTIGADGAVLTSELDEVPPPATTHIVLRGTPRSVKALCGVVSGKWLVAPEYITNSEESGFWLDEVEEGGMRIFPPPLQGQRFLLTVEHAGIRGKLAQVIAYGGGEVLQVSSGKVAQDVVVITSGDDLLRYATEGHM